MKNKLILLLLLIILLLVLYINSLNTNITRQQNISDSYNYISNKNMLANSKETSFKQTFIVLSKIDKFDNTGLYKYVVVDKFQYNTPVVIRINENDWNSLLENNYYEFTFNRSLNYNNENNELINLFNNFEIVNIVKSEKNGLEQTQELY